MIQAIALATLLTSVAAAPWSLLHKRGLEENEWLRDKRDDCSAYLTLCEFESPDYITQVSKVYPDKAYGPQHNGVFTADGIGSIFSFDIPSSKTDANCTLEFLFPKQSQLTTSSYTYSGGGSFFFKGYNPGSCPNDKTTWYNQPSPGPCQNFVRCLYHCFSDDG